MFRKASLILSPSTVNVGEPYIIAGASFAPGQFVSLGIREPDVAWYWNGYPDALGVFAFTWTASDAGASVIHDAYQKSKNGRYSLKASATLTVR